MMTKKNGVRMAMPVLCGALLAAACDSASPTAPTTTEPAAVSLTGNWRGSFTGALVVSDAVTAQLTQNGADVTGEWSAPMPAPLVTFGAPANVDLAGPVSGTVTGPTASLSFGFSPVAGFERYFAPGCALSLSVTSFTATAMEGTWMTNASCVAPVSDTGTLSLTRQ